MKQLLQNLKTGEGVVADVPAPVAQRGRVIVRAAASLISAGTERAFVELGRKSLVGKAKERPASKMPCRHPPAWPSAARMSCTWRTPAITGCCG